jgi:hypothetical protein
MALDLLQGDAIGTEEMTGLVADTKGEPLANSDMAVAPNFGSKSDAALKLQVTIGSATEAFHHQHYAL